MKNKKHLLLDDPPCEIYEGNTVVAIIAFILKRLLELTFCISIVYRCNIRIGTIFMSRIIVMVVQYNSVNKYDQRKLLC